MTTGREPKLTEAIEKLKRAHAILDGGTGISWTMGRDHVTRYDSETGKPYHTRYPASMTLSSAKLRAIVDLYEGLPGIIAALGDKP